MGRDCDRQIKAVSATHALAEYFRCPAGHLPSLNEHQHRGHPGYFRLGSDTICYGTLSIGHTASNPQGNLYDALDINRRPASHNELPFNPDEIITNLHRERYSAHFRDEGKRAFEIIRKTYYLVRPLLGVAVRRHFQKFYLRGWDKIAFPVWPVDTTVQRIHQKLLALSLQAQGLKETPFIWFWPDGFASCAIMTHDVENHSGRDFCGRLMDLDESFGIRSSFQIIPENHYTVPESFLRGITSRGFEVNVHDLKHDGSLYANHAEFLRQAERINRYVRDFGAQGFRSGILYRHADWYDAFDFSYDMSIPNVAHLDPQRGGCCTVLPYFIGKIVEIPLTCTQDYTLFHILGDYSIELWKKQISLVRENHGLVSFLVHPDYMTNRRAQDTYKSLLRHLAELLVRGNVWAPLPREVAAWWKQRGEMELVKQNGQWTITGPGNERARIAYASLAGDTVTYRLPS